MKIKESDIYNKNNVLSFEAESTQKNIFSKPAEKIKKTIDTVQKTIETGVDTVIVEEKDSKEKKRNRRRAIAAGSAVLVLGSLTLLLNPKNSGKIMSKLKTMQNQLDIKIQYSKHNFLKSKFYGACKKAFGFLEKGGNVYFNMNSGKDALFKSLCTNDKKTYPEFLTKNTFISKIVKGADNIFVKIFKKPHEKITQWFDSISRYTVKRKYSAVSKNMSRLEIALKEHRPKVSDVKKALIDKKLEEIALARKAFSEEELVKRFSSQEKLMTELNNEVLNKIYSKEAGFAKNPTKFWAEEALTKQKALVQAEGKLLVGNLFGTKDKKGLYDEALELLEKDITAGDHEKLKEYIKLTGKKLKKANFAECSQYFDKKRDLVLGGAPTDIVTNIAGLGLCGAAIIDAEKGSRWQKTLTAGLPVATGLISSLVFSAMLYSGGVGLMAGALVSGVTSLACDFINKNIFGNNNDANEKINNKENKNPQEVNNV